jgi:hypothetical protein
LILLPNGKTENEGMMITGCLGEYLEEIEK